MPSLSDLLLQPTKRPQVIDDCVAMIDQEVQEKDGLTGLAIKGVFAVVKKIKPGIIAELVDHLLDEFVPRIEPFYQQAKEQQKSLTSFFSNHSEAIANGLLGVTDERAQRAKNPTLKKAYEKLRPSALKHVQAAVPRMAQVIATHAP